MSMRIDITASMLTLRGQSFSVFGELHVRQAEGSVRYPFRIRGRQQIGKRMVAEIEAGALDRRVDDGQAVDAFLLQCIGEFGHGGDLPAAEGTMQPAEQPDEHRLLAAKIVDGDLALAGDRIQHHVRRAISRLQWSFGVVLLHVSFLPLCA